MPSSIPYDHPSLVLGNIADTEILSRLRKIGNLQAKIDAAQEKMNSHIMMKRSLSMSVNELVNLGIDVKEIEEKVKEVDAAISQAAIDYMSARLTNEDSIQQVREEIAELELKDNLESPLDFGLSAIKRLPLASDSIKLDAQYFSNDESGDNSIARIESYIREATGDLGTQSGKIAQTASAQIAQQRKNHSVAGTLIITASCTHKNVAMIEPLVLDVDKAISVWNNLYPSEEDKLDAGDPQSMSILSQEPPDNGKAMTVLSGVAYGSSFVGMVHVLVDKEVTDTQAMGPVTTEVQERLKVGSFLEDASGGFGVDPSVADDVKKYLSKQTISSHVSMVVMGVVPSIASNQVKMGLSQLADTDPSKMVSYLSTITDASSSERKTLETSAAEAKTGARLLNLKNATLQTLMRGLDKIDQGANKLLDVNSMMNAFENYLTLIRDNREGSFGAPINFYLKTISKPQLARLWMDKYYPMKDKSDKSSQTPPGS